MYEVVDAEYRKGVIKPLTPVRIRDGSRLKILILEENSAEDIPLSKIFGSVPDIDVRLEVIRKEWDRG